MNCIQCVNIKKDSTCIACKLYPHWHRIFLLAQENRRRRIERKRLNGKGTDIDIDEKEEVIDMCKAWEEQKNEGRELGREEGRELGREEGREEGRIRQAKITALKLQKKGHSIEDIAECVDFDEETVKKWLVS